MTSNPALHRREFLRRAALAAAAGLFADHSQSTPPPARRTLTSPNDALRLALLDLAELPRGLQLFTRYFWFPTGQYEDWQATSLAINLVSRSPNIIKPVPLAGGFLARIDLRWYYEEADDLNEAIKLFEEFQFDPKFNLLFTADTIKFAEQLGIELRDFPARFKDVLVDCPPYTIAGKTYTQKWVKQPIAGAVELVRQVGRHLDRDVVAGLIDRAQTQAPVISFDYFITRALRQFQGKAQLYKVLWRGLYYDLCGIKKSKEKGVSDEDLFFQNQLFMVNAKKGETARQIYDRAKSDQRAAVFISGVTDKPRQIEALPVPVGRDIMGQAFFTHDPTDDDIDISAHAVMNLAKMRDSGREVLYPRPNGLLGALLVTGEGALADVVPQEIANDRTTPAPATTALEPIKGCLSCHGPFSGYQPVKNDVLPLAKRLDIFNDLAVRNKTQPQVIARLFGQYGGKLEFIIMPQVRSDQNRLAARATDLWKGKNQAHAAVHGFARITEIINDYWYGKVNEQRAVRELGFESGTLEELLLPAAVIDAGAGQPVRSEDARIGQLQVGQRITRHDWSLAYGFAAARLRRRP